MMKITSSYFAVNSDGDEFQIDVHTRFTEHRPVGGVVQWRRGGEEHKLQDGSHVNVFKDGTLEIFDTGMKLRRV